MNIRRYYVPNAIVFITQVVDRRQPIFQHAQFVNLLRDTLNNVKRLHPFTTLGYIFLPEHFHLLIRPTGESNFSDIMHSLKPNFTKEYKRLVGIEGSMKFWQKGFWDHIIRDEVDFQRHLDYIHYNPVHHQLVQKPEEWPYSSYRYWQERGVYPPRWGWSLPASIEDYHWQSSEISPNS
jgi:putative transposase